MPGAPFAIAELFSEIGGIGYQQSAMPRSNEATNYSGDTSSSKGVTYPTSVTGKSTDTGTTSNSVIDNAEDIASEEESSSEKDYSKTNIQVENVDEADITKTDGDYIYSLSGNDVVITDVKNPQAIEIASKISSSDGSIPEDIILNKDKLTIIGTSSTNSSYYDNSSPHTTVRVYDITDRKDPKEKRKYEFYQPYYT